MSICVDGKRLQKVYILTSINPEGVDPSVNSNKWMFRYYHDKTYGRVGRIQLEENVPARYVAILSAHDKGLALSEVMVYEFSMYSVKHY